MSTCIPLEWFAIRVKSNRERVTSAGLSGKGYEVFLPEYTRNGNRPDRVPLFPGYLFSRFDVTNRLPILTVPGVVHIVSIGKTPAPVDPGELESLRVLLKTGLPVNPFEEYTVGDKVEVDVGPLSGATGIVIGQKDQRLLVSITLLQRSVSVALPREWVGKLAPRERATIYAASEGVL